MDWRQLFKPDITKAIIVIVALIVGLTLVTRYAEADGTWFPNHPRVYAGFSHDFHGGHAPECRASDWVGEFGAEHDLYEVGQSRFVLAYRHNSCLDEQSDRAIQDAVGVRWVWTVR